jgi:hypothetical protein
VAKNAMLAVTWVAPPSPPKSNPLHDIFYPNSDMGWILFGRIPNPKSEAQ